MPKESLIFKPAIKDITWFRKELYQVFENSGNDYHKLIDYAAKKMASDLENIQNYKRLLTELVKAIPEEE